MNTLRDGEVIDYVKGTGVHMDPRFIVTTGSEIPTRHIQTSGEVVAPMATIIVEPATVPARVLPKMQAYGSMLPKATATSVVIDTAKPSIVHLIKTDIQGYIQSLENIDTESASIEGAIRALRQVQKMIEKRINASMDR